MRSHGCLNEECPNNRLNEVVEVRVRMKLTYSHRQCSCPPPGVVFFFYVSVLSRFLLDHVAVVSGQTLRLSFSPLR